MSAEARKVVDMKLAGGGMTYSGEVDARGVPHGQGTVTFSEGSTFTGDFRHGRGDGRFRIKTRDGGTEEAVGRWRAG